MNFYRVPGLPTSGFLVFNFGWLTHWTLSFILGVVGDHLMRTMLLYVDPGLGLLAWQAVIAVFLGLVFYVKKARDKVLGWSQKLFRVRNRPPTEHGGNCTRPDDVP